MEHFGLHRVKSVTTVVVYLDSGWSVTPTVVQFLHGDRHMADEKKYTEKTEVKTETKRSSGFPEREESEYKKETTVKTERKVEEDEDEVIIIENN